MKAMHEKPKPVLQSLKLSDVARCPHAVQSSDHYRFDGSCRCDDPLYRHKMLTEMGFNEHDFEGIPLRKEKPRK